MTNRAQLDAAYDELQRLWRLLDLSRYHLTRFERGEKLQRAACDNLEALLRDKSGPEWRRIRVGVPLHRDINLVAPSWPEKAVLIYEGIPDLVEDSMPDEIKLAVALSTRTRVGIKRWDTGKWVMWMCSRTPGDVDPDVAFYLECREGHQAFTTYDIHERIAKAEGACRAAAASFTGA